MKNILIPAVLVLALWAWTGPAAQAQPSTGGPTPTTPTVDPTGVPIDGGASLLLLGGVAIGWRKLRQRRQAK